MVDVFADGVDRFGGGGGPPRGVHVRGAVGPRAVTARHAAGRAAGPRHAHRQTHAQGTQGDRREPRLLRVCYLHILSNNSWVQSNSILIVLIYPKCFFKHANHVSPEKKEYEMSYQKYKIMFYVRLKGNRLLR